MARITNNELIEKARRAAKLHRISKDVRIGEVGCALVTDKGNVYLGASIEACCGIGFCAEHSAIAAVATKNEYRIKKIVAVCGDGTILPPCGRCRELMYQINECNLNDSPAQGFASGPLAETVVNSGGPPFIFYKCI